MRPFITWLVLGTLVLLFGCQDDLKSARRQKSLKLNTFEWQEYQDKPTFSYSKEIELFYNEDFQLSYSDDYRTFYNKVMDMLKDKHLDHDKLSGATICDMMGPLIYSEDEKTDTEKPDI